MNKLKLLVFPLIAVVLLLAQAAPALGQNAMAAPGIEGHVAELDGRTLENRLGLNNAWMMMCSALVLFMTVPGLAMFYGGLVRRKNVLGVMMQCMFLMAMMTVIWALWGYSLSFGESLGGYGLVGNGEYLAMEGVILAEPNEETGSDGVPMVGRIPRLTHMIFQGMFFIITPALICGAFAERMKFSTMVVFSALWGTLVYCPLCHMVWGGGFLAHGNSMALNGGALDFAGGTVVHISSGVSALVCAIILGRRMGLGHDDMRPHNLTYTMIGAGMLWVGWFGFNAGSAGEASPLAANALVVTHFAAATGALAWAIAEWILRGKPSALGTASGAVAGLVCITPAAGFVQPMPALAMGAMAGLFCFLACTMLKSALKYDDSLDAFGVHGIGGLTGALLTGVFATTAVNADGANGVLYNESTREGFNLLLAQASACVVTIFLAALITFLLLRLLDLVMGLRVSQEAEYQGLDLSQHGEEGYIFMPGVTGSPHLGPSGGKPWSEAGEA